MYRWYVVNTKSGHEKKVKQNLEHRIVSLGQSRAVRQIVVPTETVSEMKEGQKVSTEKRTMPGYVLVNMDLTDDSWTLVKGTPGITGFVGASNEPVPLTQSEVDRLMHREVAQKVATKAQFSIGVQPCQVQVTVLSQTSPSESGAPWCGQQSSRAKYWPSLRKTATIRPSTSKARPSPSGMSPSRATASVANFLWTPNGTPTTGRRTSERPRRWACDLRRRCPS